ncbi:UNVERIFIED_CONTAM: hypothetical protein RF648_20180, partial [Kocuria sp. CPCC 205274]
NKDNGVLKMSSILKQDTLKNIDVTIKLKYVHGLRQVWVLEIEHKNKVQRYSFLTEEQAIKEHRRIFDAFEQRNIQKAQEDLDNIVKQVLEEGYTNGHRTVYATITVSVRGEPSCRHFSNVHTYEEGR